MCLRKHLPVMFKIGNNRLFDSNKIDFLDLSFHDLEFGV